MPQTRKDFPYDRKLPVAGRAAKGKPDRKQAARLDRRLRDYTDLTGKSRSGKIGARIDAGGYHKPGSMQ
jgi:hypothetical protein